MPASRVSPDINRVATESTVGNAPLVVASAGPTRVDVPSPMSGVRAGGRLPKRAACGAPAPG